MFTRQYRPLTVLRGISQAAFRCSCVMTVVVFGGGRLTVNAWRVLGREQAREIGAAIRAAGVTVDRALTSQWCRCRDTAWLLDLGPVEDLPVLNSFFRNLARSDRQTADSRARGHTQSGRSCLNHRFRGVLAPPPHQAVLQADRSAYSFGPLSAIKRATPPCTRSASPPPFYVTYSPFAILYPQ